MGKYTQTLEEYCQGRLFAQLLEQHMEDNDMPDDPRIIWVEAVRQLQEDPTIAYAIIGQDIMPDFSVIPFYTNDSDTIDEFISAFTDKFYFHEIGQETMGRFRITLRAFCRENMPYYADLFNSKLSALTDLNSDYQRQTHDSLEKLGKETDELSHGHKVEFEPTASQTNKIIPFGGSAETELNQSVAGGKDTTTNSGKDTTTLSFTNRVDSRWITENITGATGAERADLIEKYRALIIDIDSMIFAAMEKYGLFMQCW